MASKIVTCSVELDANATRIAEAVAAVLASQGDDPDLDKIVSNAVRLAYGDRVSDLVKSGGGSPPGEVGNFMV